MSKPKIKVVLSGSGLLYPLHAGAISRLTESFEIEEIAGVSGGSIIAALVASGKSSEDIKQVVLDTAPGDNLRLIDPSWFPPLSWGLIKGHAFLDVFRQEMSRTFGHTVIPLHVGTVNIDTQESVVFSSHETPDADLPLAVRASMSVPFAFTPVEINGNRYVDGGVAVGFPLDIFGSGEDVIGIKVVSDPERKPVESLLDYGFAVLGTMMGAIDKEHMEDAVFARTIRVKTTKSGANLLMNRGEALDLYNQGYTQVSKALNS
jgi:NTE family protein